MAKYTLHYFNLRGRAELTRLVFAAADVKYEDHRMTGQEWQELKPKAPTGQLPCMEIEIDGKVTWLGQSMAIARYVARQHGLSGENDLENARADSVVDSTVDMFAELLKKFLEKDETKKGPRPWIASALTNPTTISSVCRHITYLSEPHDVVQAEIQKKLDTEVLPKYLNMFEKLLADNPGGSEYFVGKKLTWADLAVYNIFSFPLNDNSKLMDGYPKLTANAQRVSQNSKIVEYIKNRPETSI